MSIGLDLKTRGLVFLDIEENLIAMKFTYTEGFQILTNYHYPQGGISTSMLSKKIESC